jgi:hypothetical protein
VCGILYILLYKGYQPDNNNTKGGKMENKRGKRNSIGVGRGLILATKIPKTDPVWRWSNPIQSQRRSTKYLGKKRGIIYRSTRKNKKYAIYDDIHNKMVSFGQMEYEDYTKHHDKERRKNYLTRSGKIKGVWKRNPFSANNLAREILW